MAIKTIDYTVNLTGITPTVEQLGGTQGDHRVTKLVYTVANELLTKINDAYGAGNIMYRLDVYDGEGGIWQSEPKTMEGDIELLLEERHTRFGGKITVYLVITALSKDNQTEMELYSFPSVLRLKNRPNGTYKNGENRESVVGLVEKAKSIAEAAAASANAAKAAKLSAKAAESSAKQFASEVQQKLENGEFDGEDGVSVTHSFDGTVLTMSSASGTTKVDLKGEKGEKGDKGDKGDAAKIGIDKTVNGGTVFIDEEGILTNVKFSSDAPQNTTVCIFNENVIEKGFYGETIENEGTSINLEYWGEIGVRNYYTQYGYHNLASVSIDPVHTFTYHRDSQIPPEYGDEWTNTVLYFSNVYGELEIDISDKLIPGDTYILFAAVYSEDTGRDKDGNITNMKHTVKEVYLLNKTKSTVETVRADGSISTASIKPYTFAMIATAQKENNYSLNLSYTVTNFATKKYVDEAVKNIDTSGIDISGLVPKRIIEDLGAPFSSVIAVDNGDFLRDVDGYRTGEPNDSSYHYIRVQDSDYAGKSEDSMNSYARFIPVRDENGNLFTGAPVDDVDCTNKKYVDNLVGDIETALDGIIAIQNELIGGDGE